MANTSKAIDVIKFSVNEVRFTIPVVAKVKDSPFDVQVECKLTVSSAENQVDMWLSVELAELYKASGRDIEVHDIELVVFTDAVAISKKDDEDERPITFFNPWVYASGVMKFYRGFNLR